MNEGVFAVHRGVFKHELFADEPYTEREAWLWLVGNAAWRATRVRLGNHVFDVQRGQLAHATRFLADLWKWSESKVRRFLVLLKNEQMIDAEPTRWATLITICKYDEYQFDGRRSDAQTDAEVTQKRRGSDADKKNLIIEDKKDSLSEKSSDQPKRSRLDYPQDFQQFWSGYPTDALMSKKQAFDAWKRLTPDDRAKARSAVPAFAEHCRKNPDYRPLHAVRFLTQRRYEGFAETSTDPPAEQAEFMRSKGYEWTNGKWERVAA